MRDNEKLFRQKVEKLAEVYVAKNRDYGDSFTRSLDKYGILASLVRMGDKMNRIDSLYDKPTTEVDESLVDSLEDLANYAIMTAIWLEKQAEGIERELDWNDGWHNFDGLEDDDFDDDDDDDYDHDAFLDMLSYLGMEDDEPEDDADDFNMDDLPKFRIVRRAEGGLSHKDYLDMIRYLFGTEGD